MELLIFGDNIRHSDKSGSQRTQLKPKLLSESTRHNNYFLSFRYHSVCCSSMFSNKTTGILNNLIPYFTCYLFSFVAVCFVYLI